MAEINEKGSGGDVPPTPQPQLAKTEVAQLADAMYEKVAAFLQGQVEGERLAYRRATLVSGTIEEYELLEAMNKATAQRYTDMRHVAVGVADKLEKLNKKCLPWRDETGRGRLCSF